MWHDYVFALELKLSFLWLNSFQFYLFVLCKTKHLKCTINKNSFERVHKCMAK